MELDYIIIFNQKILEIRNKMHDITRHSVVTCSKLNFRILSSLLVLSLRCTASSSIANVPLGPLPMSANLVGMFVGLGDWRVEIERLGLCAVW